MAAPGAVAAGAMPADGKWDAAYEWKAVVLLTLGFGLVGLDRWIIAPLAPSIIMDLGITGGDMNNLIAVLGVTWGVAAVFLGQLSDRIGRKKVLIPSIVIFSLMSGFSGMASSFAMIFLMRALMGVSEGAFCPTSFACTAEASKPSRRGFNQGLQQSTFALFGLGFGPIIATQLLQHTSWRGVFWLVAIPGLILAALLWFVIREPATVAARPTAKAEAAPVGPKRSWTEVFKHRNVPLGMIGLFCAMCGIFVLSANTPLYLTEYLKLSPTEMGIVTSGIGFGGFVGQWGLPAFSDWFGRRTMAVLGFGVGALFLFLFIRMDASAGVPMLFAMLFLCTAFAFGLLSLITGPIATEAAPLGMISTAAGIIIGTGEIFGGGLALVVAGWVINTYGVQNMLWLAFGGLAVGAVLMLFLKETAPRKAKSGHGAESELDKYEDEHPEGIV